MSNRRTRFLSWKEYQSTLNTLTLHFPVAFNTSDNITIPLAVGIHKQILATGLIDDPDIVKSFLLTHTTLPRYYRTLADSDFRCDLNGNKASEITDKDKIFALRQLLAHRERKLERMERRLRDWERMDRRAA